MKCLTICGQGLFPRKLDKLVFRWLKGTPVVTGKLPVELSCSAFCFLWCHWNDESQTLLCCLNGQPCFSFSRLLSASAFTEMSLLIYSDTLTFQFPLKGLTYSPCSKLFAVSTGCRGYCFFERNSAFAGFPLLNSCSCLYKVW